MTWFDAIIRCLIAAQTESAGFASGLQVKATSNV